MIGREPARIVESAQRLRQSPGFLAFGGRFLYVTPVLIARVAFRMAWERWIGADPERFLTELPVDLIDPFVEQIQNAGTPEMRQLVSDFFLGWAGGLSPPDLGREQQVSRLVRLIEVLPENFVPFLRRMIEGPSPDNLRQFHTSHDGDRARRQAGLAGGETLAFWRVLR